MANPPNNLSWLADLLNGYKTLSLNGVLYPKENQLDLIGAGVSFTVVDDPVNQITHLTIIGTPANSPWTQGAAVTTTTTLSQLANQRVGVDTTSAGFTLSLPASPNDGDWVHVADVTGACSLSKPLTVSGNGHNIQGQSTFLLQSAWDGAVFVFKGTQNVWVIQ
jgi:hypothetical protein